jgi:hypothetical protein
MSKQRKRGGYEVGYGKPPEHTRFKPGQSGNPKGRPKKAQNASTLFDKVTAEKITIKEGDKTRQVSKLEGIIQRAVNAALQGDSKAINLIFRIARETQRFQPEEEKPGGGVLLVPAPISKEEWERRYAKPHPDSVKTDSDATSDPE